MRENELNPRTRRRFSRTTDSSHDGPVFPFIAKDYEVHGPDQLWVGDITYVAIAQGFVYLTVILDAWSRRVVGHALARNLEARHSVAALAQAIALRRPLPGCIFHSDRGAQYASGEHRALLAARGFTGSMSRCGNPYDNAKAESFMKTLKAEAVYLTEYDTYEEVAADLPPSSRRSTTRDDCTPPGLPEPDRVREPQHPHPGQNRSLRLSNERGALQPLLRGAGRENASAGAAAPGLKPTVQAAPPFASAWLRRTARETRHWRVSLSGR